MPKLLIASSVAKPKDRKAATSMQNMKKLIEKRVEKDKEDVAYTVTTINTKMKLANVVAIINSSSKKLAELEGVVTVESYKMDPDKTRGRWEIESLKSEKKAKSGVEADADADDAADAPKKKKKKKKKAKKED